MDLLTEELVLEARAAVRARARERMGRDSITYADLATRSRVGKATVTRFLNGDPRSPGHWPRAEQLAMLSEGLGLDLDVALQEEIARRLVERITIGNVFGDGEGQAPHDTLVVDFGPGAFAGLSRQDILEVGSAAELAGLARLAEIRGRRREDLPNLAQSA